MGEKEAVVESLLKALFFATILSAYLLLDSRGWKAMKTAATESHTNSNSRVLFEYDTTDPL